MNQRTLFETEYGVAKPAEPKQPRQDAELKRVKGKIADVIREFASIVEGRIWTMNDLHKFAATKESIAPASADRVLRSMRAELPYTVINRSKSQYQFEHRNSEAV